MEPKLRRNGQVVQPGVEQMPEGNGWPTPLTDESSPLKMTVQNGSNGESRNIDGINTSQAQNGGWSLGEGSGSGEGMSSDGGAGFPTSQQARGEHHTPEGD